MDYVQAMIKLWIKNNNIRESYKINFLKLLNPKDYPNWNLFTDACKNWCFRFGPLIQDAIGREHETLLREYDR